MRFKLPEIPPPQLIASLRSFNLLPAIIFMPTRRRCDEAALEVAQKKQNPHAERFAARQKMFQEYAAENPEIRSHKHKNLVVRAGIASHHAGHIPAWKLLALRCQ